MRRDRSFAEVSTRAADLAITLPLIAFMAPVAALIAVGIAGFDGGPVFSRQARIGRGGRPFNQLAFRTYALAGSGGVPASARTSAVIGVGGVRAGRPGRRTPLGAAVESAALAGLPALFNVVRGEMSLVGPQPLNSFQIRRYGRHVHSYLAQRPGLTGLWRLDRRARHARLRRAAQDTLLFRHAGLGLYIRVLAAGVGALFARDTSSRA